MAEFESIKARKRDRVRLLRQFHEKLAVMRFLDPACGCGNFLVIAYRALRELELEILRELRNDGQLDLLAEQLSHIDVDQFYGIELLEFPARIAETALWMMDHIMNNRLSLEFGKVFVRIPLTTSPNIMQRDALETDWVRFLPPQECTAVLGNPPFIGSKYQSDQQREQTRRLAGLGGSGGTLDYVSAWFIKAGDYVAANPNCRIGFVATNSITRGEQVAQLWPVLFDRYGLELDFGHRTFSWDSDARGKAHVHVVIIGLSHRSNEREKKRLFTYPDIKGDPVESAHKALTAYLFGADEVADRHVVVEERSQALGAVPALASGTQPIDDGNYIFTDEERDAFIAEEPNSRNLFRRYIGGKDWINGGSRWLLYLKDVSPEKLRTMPSILERMRLVSEYRAKSPRKSTLAIKDLPIKLNVEVFPEEPFIAVPEVSSERRNYIPIGWMEPPTIPSNKIRVLISNDRWYFGILTSRMHMAWTAHVGGRLKSDYQYSIGINYNAFPWPDSNDAQKAKVWQLAQDVLAARAQHPGATLADLYDPNTMPTNLRKTHQALDDAVDRLYRRAKFPDDRARVEHLFRLYEAQIAASA